MKGKRPYSFALALSLASTLRVCGQFYAPETEFHDKAQRLFPVEVARVLAWRENQRTQTVWDVTYTVKTGTNHDTTWQITWRDKSGKEVKQFQVNYPESLLRAGPQFYREAARQIWSGAKQTVVATQSADRLNERFGFHICSRP